MYSHKRVLVPLDGSPTGEAVLRFLMEIAGPLDMTVILLHVLEPIMPQAIEGTRHFTVDDVEARRREAGTYLEPIAAALRAKGVDATCSIRRGHPPQEIVTASTESSADLIAMATHGRTGLGRLLFGSVAEEVLRHAPVPVLMIRQPHAVETPLPGREASSR
jgi:nucleotide-binding universal stress UspA family protein